VAAGWPRVVVKPAVSAASLHTILVDEANWADGEDQLRRLLATRDALVQPYLPAVEDAGERALVFIDGVLTHAVRKHPRFAAEDESVSPALPIEPDQRRLAEAALATVGCPLLYGRIDVAPGPEGAPVVMELELIEPSLFLVQHPPALERLADAVLRIFRGLS
jgi:glutathione synthase/RimK-type ligase-like ATP-grasp enzyme